MLACVGERQEERSRDRETQRIKEIEKQSKKYS
jgi:hypothetical protein